MAAANSTCILMGLHCMRCAPEHIRCVCCSCSFFQFTECYVLRQLCINPCRRTHARTQLMTKMNANQHRYASMKLEIILFAFCLLRFVFVCALI